MTDQDPDARIPDPEDAPLTDADLVLDAQPVFDIPVPADTSADTVGGPSDGAGDSAPADPVEAPADLPHPHGDEGEVTGNEGASADLPPVDEGASADLPPVDEGASADLPPVDEGASADLPPVDEGEPEPLLPADTDATGSVPADEDLPGTAVTTSGAEADDTEDTVGAAPAPEPVVLPTTIEPTGPAEAAEPVEVIAPLEPAAAPVPGAPDKVPAEAPAQEYTETPAAEPPHMSWEEAAAAVAEEIPDQPAQESWSAVTEVSPLPGTEAPTDAPSSTGHHIPSVPVTEHAAPPLPPSPSEAESAAAAPVVPDVLGNRSAHHSDTATTHAPEESDAAATPGVLPATDSPAPAPEGPESTLRTSIMAPSAAAAAAGAAAAAAPGGVGTEADDLDQTRVHRRSFVAPQEEAEDPGEAQWRPRPEVGEDAAHSSSTPRSLDDALFEGATVVPSVPSRAAAHVWSLLLCLLLVPLAWYLLADAGARMTLAPDNPMSTGILNPAALVELVGGLVLAVLVAVLVRHSSLGAHVMGVVLTVVGIPWVVAPGATARLVLPAMEWLDGWNAFGSNLAHHLQASGYSGRLLLLGVSLLLLGWVSHRTRRVGREEEALRAEVERVNPQGAHLTRRERRRAARAAGER